MTRIALSIGCPRGIGPEVSVAAAYESKARIVLVGALDVLRGAARLRGIDPRRLAPVAQLADLWATDRPRIPVWDPAPALRSAGASQLAWVDSACDLVVGGFADALVTGPVSKEAIVRSRAPGSARFRGHTEHLARRLGAREVVMAFSSAKLSTALATTHVPLGKVTLALTPQAVARAAFWLAWLLHAMGDPRPTVAVAGLNPHAGESGLLGREEITRILPGMVRARRRLRRANIPATLIGPLPAEAAFRMHRAVVAMYHDQATIPMKLVSFGDAVNVSLGLPIVRTSVDHGTAYDIAGKGIADARGMACAIRLAARLARAR
jgi:4-hydroxythreonine-4-phosphate dehydrogenase